MKIALVWNHRSRLLDCSFRFEQYLDGFRALGHDPVVVCDRDSAEGFHGPLEVVPSADRFAQPDFWRRIAADVAVIVTWHRMATELATIRDAGTRVIAIADTDGRLSLRTYPAAALERLVVYQDTVSGRLRCLKYWLEQLLKGAESAEDLEALASTRASDALIFGHERGREYFTRFLARYREQALAERIAIVPFTIGASFLSCSVPGTKSDRMVAIGRWDDPQKHAALLASALDRFFAASEQKNARTGVTIFGQGSEGFAPLARRHPSVQLAGVQSQEVVARALADARSIVFSSRWEGSPHAALEALALGATLIGPPIPSLESWSDSGRYGTVSASRRPASLARALEHEMTAWNTGQRNPREIARHWRSQLAPAAVCGRILEAL